MADNNIPFTALEKKPLRTRIYALVKLYQATERMEFLNEGQRNSEELARISDAVVAFVSSAMEGSSSPEAEAVIDNFPELMELVLHKDPKKRQEAVSDFMNKHNDIAFVQTVDFKPIAEGELAPVKLTQTLEEINAIVLENTQSKRSTYTARELAQSITDQSLNSEDRQKKLQIVLKNLQQLKKSIQTRLTADWQEYIASDSHRLDALNPVIKRITGRIDVSYQTKFKINKSTPPGQPPAPQDYTPRQKANKRVRARFSETSAKQYNRDYPENKIDVHPASKEAFLSVMGIFMKNGYDQYFSSYSNPKERALPLLKAKIAELYPDNQEEALNRILKIKDPQKLSAQQLEDAQAAAFVEKSKEIFIKSMCAGINAKRESTRDHSVPPEFIRNNFSLYVREMAENGTNDIMQLATLDENAASWKDVADGKKEKYEGKIATVHHHRPIASTIDFYLMLHPEELQKGETLDSLSEERLLQLTDKAEKLANNLGNHCLVFGADVHEILEADGFYSVSEVKDSTVLACRYDEEIIRHEVEKMHLLPQVKKALLQDIEKYSKQKDKNDIIRASIDFPDHPNVETLRKEISEQKASQKSLDIGGLLINYVKAIQR